MEGCSLIGGLSNASGAIESLWTFPASAKLRPGIRTCDAGSTCCCSRIHRIAAPLPVGGLLVGRRWAGVRGRIWVRTGLVRSALTFSTSLVPVTYSVPASWTGCRRLVLLAAFAVMSWRAREADRGLFVFSDDSVVTRCALGLGGTTDFRTFVPILAARCTVLGTSGRVRASWAEYWCFSFVLAVIASWALRACCSVTKGVLAGPAYVWSNRRIRAFEACWTSSTCALTRELSSGASWAVDFFPLCRVWAELSYTTLDA